MTDVLFYQNYTSVADVSTIAICIVNAFLLHSTYTMKKKNLTLFKLADFLVAFAAFSNISYHTLVDALTEENKLLVYVCRNTAYISLILSYVIFCIYIGNLVDISGIRKKLLYGTIWGVLLVFAFAEIAAPFTKWGFYIDSDLQIHQNYYWDAFRFAYVGFTVIVTVLLYVHRRKFITKMLQCIRNVTVTSFLVMALQSTLLTTSYTCITFTFPIIMALFLFHYNSYDMETGTLDSRAFDTYIKDLGQKKFSLICLYLQNMNMNKMKGLSEEFFHFNEKFFRYSCTFRLREDKLVMVYRDDKNLDAGEKLPVLLRDFGVLYEKYRIDYRIVIMHSDETLVRGREYLALNEFIEEKMEMNTVYYCEKKDVEDYLKADYILSELRDIHLHQNLDDERVKVYCQPVLNMATNTFTSAEALMRMELPKCGMVFPDQFIPLAEKHEYIHTLSKIILNKTCKQIKAFEAEHYVLDRVSVNFSILELRYKNFCRDVTSIIRENGVEYDKIAIELTESRNEKDFENVKNIMTSLQALGVKFYLDDFGTGYSNFERIIGLPIDIIKFDRSLTILAGKDEESRFLVESFSDIFKKSNYQILFEGVENGTNRMRTGARR